MTTFVRTFLLVALAAGPSAAAPSVAAPSVAAAAQTDRPTLVVQITFDQLRGDLLERYRPALTGGFKRVLEQGYWVRQAEAAHGITNSYPGHASLATGLFPSRHGLTANEWWLRRDGRGVSINVAQDARYPMPGKEPSTGISPAWMAGTTLAEWLKASNPGSRSVVLGSLATITYGGRSPDVLYWYDGGAGAFVASTFYRQGHAWIDAFNRELPNRPRSWSLTVPAEHRQLARPDASTYENKGRHNTFPHDFAVESKGERGEAPTPYGAWFGNTPLKDETLFELAARAVDAEQLGRRGGVDYLAIIADTTDASGHVYGPNSLEQMDTILRLDRALGKFLDHLDRTLGPNRYTLAISADHGVTDPPEEHGLHRITADEIDLLLDRVESVVAAHRGTREQLADMIAAELRKSPLIGDAYTEAQLAGPATDPNMALFKRSFRPGLTPDFPLWGKKDRDPHPAQYGVVVRFKEGMIFDRVAAVHGSPYDADRLVPVIFYGAGVRRGEASSGARTVDVAPTLASLAGARTPPGLDGKVVEAAIEP